MATVNVFFVKLSFTVRQDNGVVQQKRRSVKVYAAGVSREEAVGHARAALPGLCKGFTPTDVFTVDVGVCHMGVFCPAHPKV